MKMKSVELKELIGRFSAEYFTDENIDESATGFIHDIRQLSPRDRIATMLKLLKFLLPEMKGADISVDMKADISPLRSHLARLIATDNHP